MSESPGSLFAGRMGSRGDGFGRMVRMSGRGRLRLGRWHCMLGRMRDIVRMVFPSKEIEV